MREFIFELIETSRIITSVEADDENDARETILKRLYAGEILMDEGLYNWNVSLIDK